MKTLTTLTAAFLLLSGQALAATLTVTDAADPGTADDGECSLREAMNAINVGTDDTGDCVATGTYGTDDEILFDTAAMGGNTITLNGTTLGISVALAITGPVAGDPSGIVLDGNDASRVLIAGGAAPSDFLLELNNLTVTGGFVTNNVPGGGIWVDGADLTLNSVLVDDNHQTNFGGPIGGGAGLGVANGVTTLNESTISNNEVLGSAGNDFKGGGGFVLSGSVVMTNSQCLDNMTSQNGVNNSPGGCGVITLASGQSATITGSTISGNATGGIAGRGGGLAIDGADNTSVTIEDTEFSNNTTAGGGSPGGALAILNVPDVTITGATTAFTGNVASGASNGGAIWAVNSGLSLEGTTFTGNDAVALSGGGLYNLTPSTDATLTQVTFVGNHAGEHGGGVWDNGAPVLDAVSFNENTADSLGGGMASIQPAGNVGPTLTGVDFIGNGAVNGGGLALISSGATLDNVDLDGNVAELDGGGLYDDDEGVNDASSDLTVVTFTGNVAGQNGGGMASVNLGAHTLMDVTFDGNQAAALGGGMYNGGGSVPTFASGVAFQNNTAASGGGMANDTSSVTVETVVFTGNNAEDGTGGAISVFGADLTLDGVTCDGNATTDPNPGGNNSGGCLYVNSPGGDITITGSNFTNNTATGANGSGGAWGGGAMLLIGNFTITNTAIDGNSTQGANGEGGAIWLGGADVTGAIVGSTISNNSAGTAGGGGDNDGGGIVSLNSGASTLTLVNSTVSGNHETGDNPTGLQFAGTLSLVHSTVANNTSDQGAAVVGANTLNIQNSLIVQDPAMNPDATNPACLGAAADVTGSLATDDTCGGVGTGVDPADIALQPLADNGGATLTHALGYGSLAIDAGDTTIGDGLPAVDPRSVTPIDQRGVDRPEDGNNDGTGDYDAGAVEGGHTLDAAPVAGWRLIAPPGDGLTVQDLADINLVQGVTGSYPGPFPNVFWLYNGPEVEDYTAFASVDDALEPGRGIWWYLYDDSDFTGTPPPEFVDIEDFAFPLPFGSPLSADTDVAFTAVPDITGTYPVPAYMIGNPYDAAFQLSGVSIDVAGLQTNFYAWEPNNGAGTYQTFDQNDYVSPWQGLMSEVDNENEAPAYSFDVASVSEEEFPPLIGLRASTSFALNLTLDGTLEDGQPVVDLANRLRFEADAMAGWDRHDGSKFMPPFTTPTYALLSPEGVRDGQPYRQSVRSLSSGLQEVFTIPVALLLTGSGSFEISAEAVNLPDGWSFTLRDLETDAETNLLEDSYAFSAGATEDWQDRFEITVTPADVVGTEGDGPAVLRLSNPTPNPATGSTALVLQVPEAQHVAAHVYDTLGRLVSTVHDGSLAAGEEVRLEVDTSTLAAGAYVVRVKGETFAETRRFTVVR